MPNGSDAASGATQPHPGGQMRIRDDGLSACALALDTIPPVHSQNATQKRTPYSIAGLAVGGAQTVAARSGAGAS